jgi:hypothetical protein
LSPGAQNQPGPQSETLYQSINQEVIFRSQVFFLVLEIDGSLHRFPLLTVQYKENPQNRLLMLVSFHFCSIS